MASRTKRISSGCTASRMSAACCIISASTPSRPAVSTTTTSYCFSRANRTPSRATATGSPGPAAMAPVDDGPGGAGAGGDGARGRRPRVRREDGDAGALADDLELIHRVRPLQVARDEHRSVPLLLEPAAELARERRLAGALQTGEEDHRGRRLGEGEP